MAIDFDGINLIITLESGVTEVDVVNDLYKDWKDWMLSSPLNRRFPQALISDGGNPLTAVINQGSYIFLNNTAGWRIKPPEEDITIFLTGNLAAQDIEVATVLPTDGNFTAAILGLQPITQGVVPSMRDNLEFNTFQNQVVVDEINGTAAGFIPAYVGSDRIGTRRAPSLTLTEAKLISDGEGITRIRFNNDYNSTGETTDFSMGFQFEADSLSYTFTVVAGLDVSNCSFENLTLVGPLDGINRIFRCNVGAVTNFSGEVTSSDLESDIGLIGSGAVSAQIYSCYSAVNGTSYPRVTNIGTQELIVRDFRGSLGLAGMTGGSHSVGVYGGRLVIEATCSGGTLYVRGDPYEITDLSGASVTIVDQTTPETIKDKIWSTQVSDYTDVDTMGGYLAETVLTVGRFLAFK